MKSIYWCLCVRKSIIVFWSAFIILFIYYMNFKERLKYFLFDVFDMISFLIFVWWIVLFVRFFVANPYTVVGASMSPTFEENDFIIVDKITPRFSQLDRWDIIVFVPPGKTIPYIKRIIWLPWEVIKIQRNTIHICSWDPSECMPLDEWYLTSDMRTDTRCGIDEFTIVDWFFVMGDNRWFSTDSRCCFGLDCYEWATYEVPFDHIIGKVYFRFFPEFTRF